MVRPRTPRLRSKATPPAARRAARAARRRQAGADRGGGGRPARAGGRRRRRSVARALAKVERCAALLERVPAAGSRSRRAQGALLRPNAKALCTEPCVEYCDHWRLRRALERAQGVPRPRHAARAARAVRPRYEGAASRSAVDFEDLELLTPRCSPTTRACGSSTGALRARARGRGAGHESAAKRPDRAARTRQRVPGRRREPVDLRLPQRGRRGVPQHWAEAAAEGRTESITVNFAARGEVLEAIDRCFAGSGPGFDPLQRGPRWARLAPSPALELLVTDRDSAAGTRRSAGEPFGAAMQRPSVARGGGADARQARDELHADAGWEWRDIVLFRATTHRASTSGARRARHPHAVSAPRLLVPAEWLTCALAGGAGEPARRLAVYSVLASPWPGCRSTPWR